MITEIRNNDFQEVEKASFALVDFNATWCGPCKMLAPIIEELSEEYDDVAFYACDVDENGALAMKYGIQSIPAVGLFKNGQLVNMAVGFRPKDAFKSLIDSAR